MEIKSTEQSNQEQNFVKGIFALYVKLDSNQKIQGLSNDTVYKVLDSRILSDKTRLIVKDLKSGRNYQECNSVWFKELKTYFAVSNEMPIIGRPIRLFRTQKLEFKELEEVRTSNILAFEVLSLGYNKIVALITENSVYFTQFK